MDSLILMVRTVAERDEVLGSKRSHGWIHTDHNALNRGLEPDLSLLAPLVIGIKHVGKSCPENGVEGRMDGWTDGPNGRTDESRYVKNCANGWMDERKHELAQTRARAGTVERTSWYGGEHEFTYLSLPPSSLNLCDVHPYVRLVAATKSHASWYAALAPAQESAHRMYTGCHPSDYRKFYKKYSRLCKTLGAGRWIVWQKTHMCVGEWVAFLHECCCALNGAIIRLQYTRSYVPENEDDTIIHTECFEFRDADT